jgi:hypothetical protein
MERRQSRFYMHKQKRRLCSYMTRSWLPHARRKAFARGCSANMFHCEEKSISDNIRGMQQQ